MTIKDKHVLTFWFSKLEHLTASKGEPVSSGELARYVGQSRSTAKKYILRLMGEGAVVSFQVRYPNGLLGQIYAPTTEAN